MAAAPTAAAGQGVPQTAQAGSAAPPAAVTPAPQKNELSPVLQQLNLESIRTRSQDLFTAISSILQRFSTVPQHKWSEVLLQFSMVNVELVNLVEDIKPILKAFVVHPKNVNAENAPILPIMLSSKLLPEMEAEEAALREQILSGVSSLSIQLQTEKLQRQIEMVKRACEVAEKSLADNRKIYGLGSRQVPAMITPLDKAQAAKIAEQEKLLRAAVNSGEGLRLLPNERQQPASLPQHLVSALQPTEGGSTFTGAGGAQKSLTPSQPIAIGSLPGATQQVSATQILNRNVPSPMPIIGSTTVEGATASPMQYANSPRSGMITDASPQQQQQQQQQQQSLLQRQKVQQIQKQQHLQQQQQQQQQLRTPATPPISQTHFQQLQQQQQAQLHHQFQIQMQQQRALQQQQQQLQGNTLQQAPQLQQTLGQNQISQAGQVKPHLGQMGSNPAGSLFGNTQMPTNLMANLGSSIPSQSSMLQQRLHLGGVGIGSAGGVGMSAAGQPQRGLPSQLISDPMYNMGLAGSQGTGNLGIPLQQPLVGQSNFNSILNPNQSLNFGQQRQPPPSQ